MRGKVRNRFMTESRKMTHWSDWTVEVARWIENVRGQKTETISLRPMYKFERYLFERYSPS